MVSEKRRSKISFYGVEKEVIDMLFKQNMSSPEVEEYLKNERGIFIDRSSIDRFREFVLTSGRDLIQEDEELKEKMRETLMNSKEQLLDLLIEIKQKLEFYKETSDWRAHSRYLELAQKNLYLVMKRLKEIGSDAQTNNITYNITSANTAIQERVIKLIEHLLSQGVPLGKFPPEWQELYKRLKGIA